MKLPTYKSHKIVEGFQIGSITPQQLGTHDNTVEEPRLIDGIPVASKTEYVITSEDGQYYVVVGDDYVMKHDPYIGGYFVRYKDGYESFSPAQAFEDGHVQTEKRRVLHVTLGNSFSPTLEDIQMVMDMFKSATNEEIGAVVATIPEVNSYLVDVQDGPDFELVRVTLDDEPLVKDEDGNPIVLGHAVDFRIEGARLPDTATVKRLVSEFAPLLDNPEEEIDSEIVEEYNVEAFQDGNTNEILISVLLKEQAESVAALQEKKEPEINWRTIVIYEGDKPWHFSKDFQVLENSENNVRHIRGRSVGRVILYNVNEIDLVPAIASVLHQATLTYAIKNGQELVYEIHQGKE